MSFLAEIKGETEPRLISDERHAVIEIPTNDAGRIASLVVELASTEPRVLNTARLTATNPTEDLFNMSFQGLMAPSFTTVRVPTGTSNTLVSA